MNKSLTPEHSKEVLREMLFRVAPDVNPEFFDFNKKKWFWDYEWSEEEQEKFIQWLAIYLKKHRYIRSKSIAIHEAKKIVANYGWKLRI